MRKRQFGSKKLVYASEHNTAQNYMELNVKELSADAGVQGIISGGDITPHINPYLVTLDSLVARTSTGDRIVVQSPVSFSMLPSVNPGAGNEIWVTSYIEYDYITSESDIDGNGVPYYKDYLNGYDITTIQGSIAASGMASRPSIPADSVLLCDILYDATLYGTGNIQASDIDISRRTEGGMDEYVRKDGDVMSGALIVQSKITAYSIDIDWAPSTAYTIGSIINYNSSLYRCTTAHTSSADFNTDSANWSSVSGGGGSVDEFTITSTGTTDVALSFTPISQSRILVSVCGVLQHQSAYSLAGNIVTFGEALVANNTVQVLRIG